MFLKQIKQLYYCVLGVLKVVICNVALYPPLAPGNEHTTSPLPGSLECTDKRHIVLPLQLAFFAQLQGATISCLEMCNLIIFLSQSLHLP